MTTADRNTIHISITTKTKKYLDNLREKWGLSSYSQAVNWMAATDKLANYLENSGHKIYTADGKIDVKEDSKDGVCELAICKYQGKVTKGVYREYVPEQGEYEEVTIYMCPKHLGAT